MVMIVILIIRIRIIIIMNDVMFIHVPDVTLLLRLLIIFIIRSVRAPYYHFCGCVVSC